MKLERAEEKLKEAGAGYTIVKLEPPAGRGLDGDTETRVVRQSEGQDGAFILYVCEV
jgi:hypothetical protein